jgi:hypothetical protein
MAVSTILSPMPSMGDFLREHIWSHELCGQAAQAQFKSPLLQVQWNRSAIGSGHELLSKLPPAV